MTISGPLLDISTFKIIEFSQAFDNNEYWAQDRPDGSPQKYKFANLPVVDSDDRKIIFSNFYK